MDEGLLLLIEEDDEWLRQKPKIYITRDREGIFLWFSTFKPRQKRNGPFRNDMAGGKIRLPQSWFGRRIHMGECLEVHVDEVIRTIRSRDELT